MRWLLGCGTLLALAFALFAVPARLEGPVLLPISPGHGLALADAVALLPLLGGVVLLYGGLWQRRERLDATLNQRPWLGRAGIFGAGVGLGLLVASVFASFWWWAVGAGLLTAALLGAAAMVGRDDRGATGEEGQYHRPTTGG
jgi:hypothetical protein